MAFKRQPDGDLVAWDRHAPTALAQILIMGGKLRPDFDTREFDRRIGRRRGTRLPQPQALRFMMTELPQLNLAIVNKTPAADFLNPERLAKFWVDNGVKPHLAKRYVGSKRYARARENAVAFLTVGREFGARRFQDKVTAQPRKMIEQALSRGAVAITADAESRTDVVMLVMSERSPGKVRVYFPEDGMAARPTTLAALHEAGLIDLDHFGAVLHAM